MDNIIDEKWISIPLLKSCPHSIRMISNTGKYRRSNGEIGILRKSHQVSIDGKKVRCSHLIAEHFLITVRRPDQVLIDHITHNPECYNVNNVLNLRWCTNRENCNFEEAREHLSGRVGDKHSMYGKKHKESSRSKMSLSKFKNNHRRKTENVTPRNECLRALRAFRKGLISEEEYIEARNKYNEYIRPIRQKKRAARKQLSLDN